MASLILLEIQPGTSDGASFMDPSDVTAVDLYNQALLTEVTEAKFCDADASGYITKTTSNFPAAGGSTLQTMAPAATARAPVRFPTSDGQISARSGYDAPSTVTATADASTDVITAAVGTLVLGAIVKFSVSAGGSLPSPLAVDTLYYVRDPAAGSFKVSAAVGGAAIDLTTAGTGTISVSWGVPAATRSTLRSTAMSVPSGAWAVFILGRWELPSSLSYLWAVNDQTLRFGIGSTNAGVVRWVSDITAGTIALSASGVNDGAKHLWAVEWDGTTLTIYKDGTAVLTSTNAPAAAVDRLFRTFSYHSGGSDATAPGGQGAGYWEFHAIGKPVAAVRAWAKAKALSYHPSMTIA